MLISRASHDVRRLPLAQSPPPPSSSAPLPPLAPPDAQLPFKLVVVFTLNGDRAAMEAQLASIRHTFALRLGIDESLIAISGIDGTGLKRRLLATQVRPPNLSLQPLSILHNTAAVAGAAGASTTPAWCKYDYSTQNNGPLKHLAVLPATRRSE